MATCDNGHYLSLVMEVPAMTLQSLKGSGQVGSRKLDPAPEQGHQILTVTLALTGSVSGTGQRQPDPAPTLVWCIMTLMLEMLWTVPVGFLIASYVCAAE